MSAYHKTYHLLRLPGVTKVKHSVVQVILQHNNNETYLVLCINNSSCCIMNYEPLIKADCFYFNYIRTCTVSRVYMCFSQFLVMDHSDCYIIQAITDN